MAYEVKLPWAQLERVVTTVCSWDPLSLVSLIRQRTGRRVEYTIESVKIGLSREAVIGILGKPSPVVSLPIQIEAEGELGAIHNEDGLGSQSFLYLLSDQLVEIEMMAGVVTQISGDRVKVGSNILKAGTPAILLLSRVRQCPLTVDLTANKRQRIVNWFFFQNGLTVELQNGIARRFHLRPEGSVQVCRS